MGCWGYYDDESDSACDAWSNLLLRIYKNESDQKNNSNGNSYLDFDFNYFENKLQEDITVNPDLYKKINEYIKLYSSQVAIGICMTLIKLLNNKSMQYQPFYGIPPPSNISIKLHDSFPDELRLYIIECIECELDCLDEGGWKSNIDRQKALNHEMYIFSKGARGSNTNKIKNSFEKFLQKDVE